jgi:hypothetical protein
VRHDPDVADLGKLHGGLGRHFQIPRCFVSSWPLSGAHYQR